MLLHVWKNDKCRGEHLQNLQKNLGYLVSKFESAASEEGNLAEVTPDNDALDSVLRCSNVTDDAVEQQAQKPFPEQPRSASNTQQLPDGSSRTVSCKDRVPTPTPEQQFIEVKALLSEDDQFVVADTDAIGLAQSDPIDRPDYLL